ncbi:hypothetical protein FB567DRAFT_603906 [Paraphoma chrysanthemicola]|uniref:Uncharacterized protein n=1 Tax=Paraphoma chrysanthemicola TaxID=798071 RepID=A0A8K0R3M0_9PLEO|nr:hypothetical protein FB567DRAFT_603906 [Paraphoma chrysanthemicola]
MQTSNLIFLYVLSVLLLQGFGALLPSPAARAIAPRSQPTSWSLPHRVQTGSLTQPPRSKPQIESKRQNQQIPFAFCPEFFNEDPKVCSLCGGDSNIKGTCNNLLVSGDQSFCQGGKPCRGYFCKCSDSGGPDNSPKVTMTSVVDGETGIVIWEPMTLDEYRNLRAATTITLTEIATTTGAGSEAETVAALVLAGGAAWYLACSQEADQSCKNHEEKPECESCGGYSPLGLCMSGNQQNCPCEEQECPKDVPPMCPAQDCDGTDSTLKCAAKGKLKGCQCCPDKPPQCDADDCNGDDKDKPQCQSGRFKGYSCETIQFPEQEIVVDEPYPITPDSNGLTAQADTSLQKIWEGDLAKVPGYRKQENKPFCLHGYV